MKNNLLNPCDECPFRKNSIPGWLGAETAESTFHHVTNEGDFACHKTRSKPLSLMSRCKGSLLFLKKACKSPKYNEELKVALKKEKGDTSNILLVNEFFNHHNK